METFIFTSRKNATAWDVISDCGGYKYTSWKRISFTRPSEALSEYLECVESPPACLKHWVSAPTLPVVITRLRADSHDVQQR